MTHVHPRQWPPPPSIDQVLGWEDGWVRDAGNYVGRHRDRAELPCRRCPRQGFFRHGCGCLE